MNAALREHWPHYLIEAAGLGTFMFVAGTVAALLAHSTMSDLGQRALFGAAMGATVIGISYSPWGSRSGSHLNPSMTLAFAWLKKLAPWDAAFYIAAQFAGAFLGLGIAALTYGSTLTATPVDAIVTKPGTAGIAVAFAAEFAMTFVLMSAVLYLSNATPRVARFTGLCSGLLVATFITFEAPLSGMSLNPARTFASTVIANDWTALWLYFIAPPLGMVVAAVAYTALHGEHAVKCGRLHHESRWECIFRCLHPRHPMAPNAPAAPTP